MQLMYKNNAILLHKVQKNTENINPTVSKTINGKTMMLSKCATCGSEKSKFIKEQEAKGLLKNLGIRTLLSNIPLLGDIFFKKCNSVECSSVDKRLKNNV